MISVVGQPMVIGVIHSPYKSTGDAPFQGTTDIAEIELFKDYTMGLQDIEGFSHVHVFYWLHQSRGYELLVKTPWDIRKHGLFTTRSPHRPTPLGYAVVELVKRKGNILYVKGLDAIEGTPVVDIKPYIKDLDAKPAATAGWLATTSLKRHTR